jgi:arginase
MTTGKERKHGTGKRIRDAAANEPSEVTRQYALLGAPSAAGTHGPGQELAPSAVRAAGLVERLRGLGVDVEDHGDLPAVPFASDPANPTKQNVARVIDLVRRVAEAVGELLDGGGTPLVIGGDCTITLGVVAAYVRRMPAVGLMYFDGDIDVATPETSTSGILDTMGMSHLLGRGVRELAAIGDRLPLLAADHIVAFGFDEREPTAEQHAWLRAQGVDCRPANGMADATAEALDAWTRLAARSGPLLLHFDVDVIDSTDLPLADFPHFNEGLRFDAAMAALRTFCGQPAFAGIVITEINPLRDPDGTLLARLLDPLTEALAGAKDGTLRDLARP